MKVPPRSSLTACRNSACVFITIGPYQATGSSIGFSGTRREAMAFSAPRLLDRLAGDEQEADAFVARLHRHLVAAVEHDERAVADALAHQRLAGGRLLLGGHAERR